MKYKFEYFEPHERQAIIDENPDKYLIEERNISEGNFLIFTDERPLSEEVEALKQENKLLEAKNNALSERADFIEDVVAEMAIQVHQ